MKKEIYLVKFFDEYENECGVICASERENISDECMERVLEWAKSYDEYINLDELRNELQELSIDNEVGVDYLNVSLEKMEVL